MALTRVKKVPTANLVQGSSFLTTVAMANITDFSTGTFSPTFYIGSTNNTDSSSGYYTKIGKLVHVSFQINLQNSRSGSGGCEIRGLPFAFKNETGVFPNYPIYGNDYIYLDRASMGGAHNDTKLYLYRQANGINTQLGGWSEGDIHASNSQKRVYGSFVYESV